MGVKFKGESLHGQKYVYIRICIDHETAILPYFSLIFPGNVWKYMALILYTFSITVLCMEICTFAQ